MAVTYRIESCDQIPSASRSLSVYETRIKRTRSWKTIFGTLESYRYATVKKTVKASYPLKFSCEINRDVDDTDLRFFWGLTKEDFKK